MAMCEHGWAINSCPHCEAPREGVFPPIQVETQEGMGPDTMAMAHPNGQLVLSHITRGVIKCDCGHAVFRARAEGGCVFLHCERCKARLGTEATEKVGAN